MNKLLKGAKGFSIYMSFSGILMLNHYFTSQKTKRKKKQYCVRVRLVVSSFTNLILFSVHGGIALFQLKHR